MSGGLLSLVGVSKGYLVGSDWLRVLSNVSLEVGPGEVVAVGGPRLSGKTTLLRVAAGIVKPQDGKVWLGDRELTSMSRWTRGRLLGREIVWVNREGPGLSWRVGDYVAMPFVLGRGRGQKRRLVSEAFERVGLAQYGDRRWGDLDPWERVLVSLARAFAARPRVLLLDGLFDAVGHVETNEAGDLLRAMVRELRCGVVMSVSDVEPTLIADRVFRLARGELSVWSDHRAEVIDATQRFPGRDLRSIGA